MDSWERGMVLDSGAAFPFCPVLVRKGKGKGVTSLFLYFPLCRCWPAAVHSSSNIWSLLATGWGFGGRVRSCTHSLSCGTPGYGRNVTPAGGAGSCAALRSQPPAPPYPSCPQPAGRQTLPRDGRPGVSRTRAEVPRSAGGFVQPLDQVQG